MLLHFIENTFQGFNYCDSVVINGKLNFFVQMGQTWNRRTKRDTDKSHLEGNLIIITRESHYCDIASKIKYF